MKSIQRSLGLPVLLMADAVESVALSADLLDTNVNDIDTSYPRIPAGLYDLKVKSAKKEPTKAGDGERLTVVLETTTDVTSTEGAPLGPGHKITQYIGITPLPERTKDGKTVRAYTNSDIAKSIAGIAQAANLNVSPRAIIDMPAQLEGCVVRAKVGISPETDNFGESNNIKSFVVRK